MFSYLLKTFVKSYQLDLNELGRRIDRHPSRIRHWMTDSKPGKKVLEALILELGKIVLEGSMDDYRSFVEECERSLPGDSGILKEATNLGLAREALMVFFRNQYGLKTRTHYKEDIEAFAEIYATGQVINLYEDILAYYNKHAKVMPYESYFQLVELVAKVAATMAVIHQDANYADKGIEVLDETHRVFPKAQVREQFQIKRLYGLIYGMMSNVMKPLVYLKKGIEVSRQAYELYDSSCDEIDYIKLLLNLSTFHYLLALHENPLMHLKKSLGYVETFRQKMTLDYATDLKQLQYTQILSVYSFAIYMGDSEHYFMKVQEVYEEIIGQEGFKLVHAFMGKALTHLSAAHAYIGALHGDDKLVLKALMYMERARDYYKDPSFKPYLMETYLNTGNFSIILMKDANCEDIYHRIQKDLDYVEVLGEGNEVFKTDILKGRIYSTLRYLLLVDPSDEIRYLKLVRKGLVELEDMQVRLNDQTDLIRFHILLGFFENRDRANSLVEMTMAYAKDLEMATYSDYVNDMAEIYIMLGKVLTYANHLAFSTEATAKEEVLFETAKLLVSKRAYEGLTSTYDRLFAIPQNVQNRML